MSTQKSNLGRANWKGVWGWALDTASPQAKSWVEIVLNDTVVGRVRAADPRPQLKVLPPEQRDCGFQFLFPNGLSALSRHVVHARFADGGRELHGSPVVVEANPGFDPALEQTLSYALDVATGSAKTQADLDHSLAFVAGQIDRLIEARRRLPGDSAAELSPELADLHRRWSGLLADPAALAAAFPEPDTGAVQRRALVIGDSAPMLDASARLGVARVAALRRLGLAVDFVAAEFRPPSAAQVAAIEATGAVYVRPPMVGTVEELLRRNRRLYDTVLIRHVENFEKYAALAAHYCPVARVVFDVDSLLFLRTSRRAALQNWPAGQRASEALRQREMTAAWGASHVIAASAFEAALVRRAVPQARVHVVGWPVAPQGAGHGFLTRSGIGLVGDFSTHADLDGAACLVELLMPAVWAIDPSITCVIAGTNMPEALRALSHDGVEVLDLAPGTSDAVVFDRVRLTVATQRAGAGLLPGALASFAAGIPCVGTSAALEGFELPDSLRACVTDDVAALAALVCQLHADEAANAALAEAGRRFVAEAFSEAEIDRRMLQAIGAKAAK